jgi:hypothetical protein
MRGARLYRYAGMTARVDSPSVLVLLARGWRIEHVDERYSSVLMSKEEVPEHDADHFSPSRRDGLSLGLGDLPRAPRRPRGLESPRRSDLTASALLFALFLVLLAGAAGASRVLDLLFAGETFDGAGEVIR